ncbi:signal recognition particle protein [Breoghania sp.]|uniref:signal recognition particle protein n=1 Tax=Breoghania sp. TaxID=2065378 RepID=UPI002AA6EC00|nr:signal recognition particle protein [Breoghania sp.]
MFESLSDRLSGIFDSLTRRGALSDADVTAALREVRRALIEADVSLDVVRSFTDKVRNRAIGHEVVKSVTPGQMVVKIVHDQLVEMLGAESAPIDLNAPAPVAIMMVGLQGSGKTTTSGKIALRLTNREKRKVLMASLDTRRPAAQEQLKVLGEQNGIDTLPIVAGQSPTEIARRAETAARLGGYDVVIFDTAGRTHIDEPLMVEMAEIKQIAKPHEILLVADSLTGQDAVNLARSFDERVGITGIVLTRMDGDGRGGAALSMRAVTGKPVKLVGTGEKSDALEEFHPGRIADRILGMGDIVSLVEKASEAIDAEQAAKMAKKLKKGEFDLDDLSEQLQQMEKLGGMSGMLGMLPGVGKMKKQLEAANLDDSVLKRQRAIISSMTKKERKAPKLLNASRKKRIAAGSGTQVQDVNKLLKMHRQMADMMKAVGKKKGGMMGALGGMMGGGGMPQMDPAEMERLAKQMGGPGGMPSLPPGGLPGMPGGGLPGGLGGAKLPGLPGIGKKK